MPKLSCISAAISIFFAGCQGSCLPQASKTSQNPIRIAIPASPLSLDPRLATDAYGQKISELLFDGLFQTNERLELVPHLVKNYQMPDDRTYQFELRHGVRFHNGRELVAEDVIDTYRSILNPETKSPFKNIFARIEEMKVLDSHRFLIRLNAPYSPFLLALKKGILARGEKMPVGSGPYELVEFEPEKKLILKSNPNHFLEGPANERLIFEVIKDDTTRALKVLSGEIDWVENAVSPALFGRLKENPKLEIKSDAGITFAYVGINLRDPILRNKQFRQSLAYALDRRAIIKHKWFGFAREARSLLSPLHWAYEADLPGYAHDLAKAKQLLAASGVTHLKLVLKTSTVKERIAMARMMAHQWEALGIEVEVRPYEWATFYEDIKRGNFQLYSLTWVGVVEPDLFYDILHSSQWPPNGSNRSRFQNPLVDEWTERARLTFDREERRKLYREVQKTIVEELPFIPLWYEDNIIVYQKGISGVRLRPDASFLDLIALKREGL